MENAVTVKINFYQIPFLFIKKTHSVDIHTLFKIVTFYAMVK